MSRFSAAGLILALALGLSSCASRGARSQPLRDVQERWAAAPRTELSLRAPIASDEEDEPAIPIVGDPDAPEEPGAGPLELDVVLSSVEQHFPVLLAAQFEFDIARAKQRAAQGAFDLNLKGSALSEFEGFYEANRLDVGFLQPIETGGIDVLAGYRLGRGDFAEYDEKAKTNDEGELRLGVSLPLLRGRSVDKRRVAAWRARLAEERAAPSVRGVELRARLDAAVAYWKWVGAGRKLEIARTILALAEDRNDQLELAVREGELAPITLTDNERSIVSRRAKLFEAERAFQEASIKLSLFLRDEDGLPRMVGADSLPDDFPEVPSLDAVLRADGDELAMGRRPEIRAAELFLEDIDLQLELAKNDTLPDLDLDVFASQDYGDASSTPDDKGPFELAVGLRLNVPIQRNAARGKLDELEARARRSQRKLQFVRDKVRAEVLDAESAVRQSFAQLEQAARNVVLANELARAEQVQVLAGESDLFRLNLREQQAAIAGEGYVDVLQQHFQALALYRAVLGGRDPSEVTP